VNLKKKFDVACTRDEASRCVARDETLLDLFPDTRTEIVESEGERRTLRSHYTALGQEGVATFHFTFLPDGDIVFEKVCDGRVWRSLEGSVRFVKRGEGTRVELAMDGRTKSLVPEFTIKGALQEQIEQMADALRGKIEGM
jgi:hypothetical protein